jgi:hypothetical protein
MHNVHFILINADSAKDAAIDAENEILEWGTDNNWRSIGGVASEDGTDDLECYESKGYPLSFLDDLEGIPKGGSCFERTVAYVKQMIGDPIQLYNGSYPPAANMKEALALICERLTAFDTENGNSHELWAAHRNLQQLEQMMDGRGALADPEAGIPEFYAWSFDEVGLTDMTGNTEGAKRYLVFLDMHS